MTGCDMLFRRRAGSYRSRQDDESMLYHLRFLLNPIGAGSRRLGARVASVVVRLARRLKDVQDCRSLAPRKTKQTQRLAD